MPESSRVFIIDRQPLFRHGIRSCLSGVSGIEACGEGEFDMAVLPLLETSLPDVVLLGLDDNELDGFNLSRAIKQRLSSVATIILTPRPGDEQLFQAIKAQASAYLSKSVTTDELIDTMRKCACGEHPINESMVSRPKVGEQILEQFHQLSREKEITAFVSPLTHREGEILNYMAQGYLNKQIAEVLNVSEQTIKNHVTSILRKLNANARTQAVIVAIKKGLVSIT
jgi:two-component system, NarL family, response regulator DegU